MLWCGDDCATVSFDDTDGAITEEAESRKNALLDVDDVHARAGKEASGRPDRDAVTPELTVDLSLAKVPLPDLPSACCSLRNSTTCKT